MKKNISGVAGLLMVVLFLFTSVNSVRKEEGLLFSDDFSEDLEKWTVVSGKNWTVKGGFCFGGGNEYGAIVPKVGEDWEDYVFEVKMKTDEPGIDGVSKKQEVHNVAWLYFRYGDEDNRYTISIFTDGRLRFWKREHGVIKELKSIKTEEDTLKWNKVRVELKDENIKVYVNDKLYIDHTDAGTLLKRGKVSLAHCYAASCRFDDVKVWEYGKAPAIKKEGRDMRPKEEKVKKVEKTEFKERKVKVMASSFLGEFRPENAIDGKVEHFLDRWVSCPKEPMPQWLVIDFGEKRRFCKIYIHWDGQQEGKLIVPDYSLQYWDGKDWVTIESIKDNKDEMVLYQFPEVSSDKFRLYVTRVPPEDVNRVVRLYEIVVMDEDDTNICSGEKFDVDKFFSWLPKFPNYNPFYEMAHYWWYGRGKFFADGTKLIIDMHYTSPTRKSVVPVDKNKMFGAILHWYYPLKKGTPYEFCLTFEEPPDYVLVNNYKVWDIKKDKLKDKRKILFTYTPKTDNERPEIILVKDPSYGTKPILAYGKENDGKTLNLIYRRTFAVYPERVYEKVTLPSGLTYYTIPGREMMGWFGELHEIPVEWTGGFPEKKDYPIDNCQVLTWHIKLPTCVLDNKIGVDVYYVYSGHKLASKPDDFNPKALLHYGDSAGWSLRGPGESYWGDYVPPIESEIARYNHHLKIFPNTEIWVGYLEQFWRDRYLMNNPEWRPLLANKNRFDWLRATFKINTEWKNNILKKVASPERVKFYYDTNAVGWPLAYYYHQGADILGNKNIGRQNGNIALSNVRGAATAYGLRSAFTADPYPCHILHQYSPDEYEQFFYVGYFGGADIVGAQCLNVIAWGDRLNIAGIKIAEFGKFTKTHPKRGEQIIKIGLIRGFGDWWNFIWCPGSDELETNMHREIKDHKDYNLLDIFYPNFGDYNHTNPDRFFTGTPYGDIDMLPWDTPLEKLKKYDLLYYSGINAMDEAQYKKLKEYVRQGGKLIMTCGHLQKEGGDIVSGDGTWIWCPAGIEDEVIERPVFKTDVRDLFGVEIGGKEGDIYQLKIRGAKVISRIGKQPLVVKKSLGKGTAYLFATKHYTTTPEGEKEARKLIKELAEKIKLIEFSPESEWLQYFIQKKKDTYILAFFNHGRMRYPAGNGPDYGIYKGEIALKLDLPEDVEAFEVNMQDMSLKPIPVMKKGRETILKISVDRKIEIIIGPRGKTKHQFFYGT